MQTGTLISLALYFILMLAIGLYAWTKSVRLTARKPPIMV